VEPTQKCPTTQQQQQQSGSVFSSLSTGALNPGATDISSVASSFAFSKPSGATNTQPPSTSGFPPIGALNAQATAASTTSTFSDSLFSSSLSSQPTGMTNTSTPSVAPMKPQMTGFAGLKPFKPSSSFGTSLMESLPPITGSSPSTPTPATNSNTSTSSGGPTLAGPGSAPQTSTFVNSSATGLAGTFGSSSSLGQGLRPQITGGGAANPFRASMMGLSSGTPNFNLTSSLPPLPSFPTSMPGSSFGSSPFGGTSSAFNPGSASGQNQQQQQQQNGVSLV